MLVLSEPRREDVVPEKCHLFLQRAFAVEHAVYPNPDVCSLPTEVTLQDVLFDGCPAFGMHEFLDNVFITFLDVSLKFGSRCAESGAPHEVRHLCDIVIIVFCHDEPPI